MRAALAQWADEEAESRAAADGYRAAVEAAWSQSMGEGERRDERAAEAKQAADRAAVRAADALSPAAPDDVRRFSARAPPPQPTRQVREWVELVNDRMVPLHASAHHGASPLPTAGA
jgi:hypothetical protein